MSILEDRDSAGVTIQCQSDSDVSDGGVPPNVIDERCP